MKRPLRINVRYRVTILCTSKSATTPGTQTMREVVKRDWNRRKVRRIKEARILDVGWIST